MNLIYLNQYERKDMQICSLVILDQQNLFLLISARITIYDLLYRDFRLGRDRPSWNLRIHCF